MRAGDFQGKIDRGLLVVDGSHTGSERTPRGESGDDALLRFAHALRRLLSRTESVTLLIVHEANALPYLVYEYAIERAAARPRGVGAP